MSGNDLSRIDHDTAASAEAQANFLAVAVRLDGLISSRQGDVSRAMAHYAADGVSDVYQGKEARWHAVADQVTHIVRVLRESMGQADEIAHHAQSQARGFAEGI